ncbi:MAG TPA: c-type cytochrome [Candidatus Acidoferrales bacterium]|jgi:cytochrome c oxidase cbb3-type subunit 3|nr:c-type cytochrome [Candidatus Acidoferrales bacterium]
MRVNNGLIAATAFVLTIAAARIGAQGPPPAPGVRTPPAQGGPGGGGRRAGGFVPGQQRPPGDPAQIARGKTIYGISCTSCHGADLRGGDLGGPNLLRSQVALSDRDGELIVPIIQGSRQDGGMPAIKLNPEDEKAVAAYVRSVLETIGTQGKPPAAGQEAPSVLVGNASEGQAYFAAKCSSCHSATGDLQGIATRIADPKALQNTWVSGGGGGRRGGRGAAPQGSADARTVTVAVTPPSGERTEGRLVLIDDFLVTVGLADGTMRTFRRDGDVPKVEVRDPVKAHSDMLPVYTDKAMHDVTAYLVTLK